jgi:hypothetical protein
VSLLETHPHLGLAAFEARWQEDLTGEYPGQQFSEILRHDYELGACKHCGAPEHRHTVVDRLLVGENAGYVQTAYWQRRTCRSCPGGSSCLSTHRRPW